jgi:hypothetical protein
MSECLHSIVVNIHAEHVSLDGPLKNPTVLLFTWAEPLLCFG